jgi:hypothetical protein
MFRTVVRFYGEELLAPHPTPKLKDQSLSAVRYYLVNIFAAILQIRRPFLHTQPEDAKSFGDQGPTYHGAEI